MYKFILILTIILVLIAFLLRKYSNPYTLTFLFGKKGSGKSTYMVKCMRRDIKKGWNVYCNMDDVKIPGIRFFNIDDLATYVPEPHSSIYVDEGGLIWDNRNFKTFNKGYTEFFKLQRKYKCKVMINSQSFDIDLKIRQLVDKMMLFNGIGGFLSIGRPIIRNVVLTEPIGDAESRIADRLRFLPFWRWKITLLPLYFKYFDSFKARERPPMPFRELIENVKSISDTSVKRVFKREKKETSSK